jgi:hypothetical protein
LPQILMIVETKHGRLRRQVNACLFGNFLYSHATRISVIFVPQSKSQIS